MDQPVDKVEMEKPQEGDRHHEKHAIDRVDAPIDQGILPLENIHNVTASYPVQIRHPLVRFQNILSNT